MKYRTIGVNLNRDYRNDLNANFEQIEKDILENKDLSEQQKSELLSKLTQIDKDSKERDEFLSGVNVDSYIQSINDTKKNANDAAAEARTMASEAENQASSAEEKARIAQEKADYAQVKGDYANEKAELAIEAAELAEGEAANLGQMKIAVTDATQSANVAAEAARTNANHAKTQGDYAKEQADVAAQRTEELNGLEVSQFYDRQEEFSRQLADTVKKTDVASVSSAGITTLYDGLNSSNTAKALTANQGFILKNITDFRDYLGYGEYTLPSDFVPRLPFSLYRDMDGKMKHTWDLEKTFEQNAEKTYYVDTVNGLDTNNGDQATPFLSLTQALFIATNSAFKKIVIRVKGNLWRNAVQNDNSRRTITNKQIAIVPDSSQEKVIIANGIDPSTLTWTADQGVYKTTQSAIFNVIDLSNKDWKGVAKPLTPVSSVSLCTTTPNSYYTDGTSVWVNTFDGRRPDSDIVTLKNVSAFMFQLTNATLYIRGLHIYSGFAAPQSGDYTSGNNGVADIMGDFNSNLIHNKCIFSGGGFGGTISGQWQSVPSLNGLKAWEIGKVYGFNSVCAYVFRDGFNYHYQSVASADRRKYLAFEFECVGYECGFESSTYPQYNLHNNNATTAHEGVSVIRVGCVGYNTDGHVQADIAGCYNIHIDCSFRDSKAPAAYSMVFTNDGVTNKGKAILINCEGNKNGVFAEGDLPIYVRNLRNKKFSSQTQINYLP